MTKYWMAALVAGFISPVLLAGENAVPAGAKAEVEQQVAPAFDFEAALRASEGSGLAFDNAWVRAMPPFQTTSAAYMNVTNNRETAIAIVGARTDAAQRAELHTTRKVEGLMRMEKLEGLAVAPGERAQLAPGGHHLMLINLAFRPVPGDDIILCLQLATDEEVCTAAEVRKGGSSQSHHHNH